jgi:hypothetical protein
LVEASGENRGTKEKGKLRIKRTLLNKKGVLKLRIKRTLLNKIRVLFELLIL